MKPLAIVGAILGVLVVLGIASSWPEIERYRRIRAM
jgi:hypothetical protein